MTDRREILAFEPTGVGHPHLWYVEGNHPKVLEREGGSEWFQFEEPLVKAVKVLRELDFSMDEIRAARERQ